MNTYFNIEIGDGVAIHCEVANGLNRWEYYIGTNFESGPPDWAPMGLPNYPECGVQQAREAALDLVKKDAVEMIKILRRELARREKQTKELNRRIKALEKFL